MTQKHNPRLTAKMVSNQLQIGLSKSNQIIKEIKTQYNPPIVTQKHLDKWLCCD